MDEAWVLRYIAQMYPDADIFTSGSGTFISCGGEKLLDEAHERVARARRKVAEKKGPTWV